MASNLIKNMFWQLQKRFLQSSATLSSNSTLHASGTCSSSSFTVEYLVNSCGLPLESALSVSQKFQLDKNNTQKAHSVVQLFKSHNFSDTQLAKLIVKYPRILHCKVEVNLQAKLDYLVENGFVGELLPLLIFSNPSILKHSLSSHIKPSFELLRSVLDSDYEILTAIKRASWLLTCNLKVVLQPKIDFLRKEGMTAHVLGRLITSQPRVVLQKHERMVYAVNAVKNLGFEPTSPMFSHALRVMIQLSESTWNRKIEAMKSMGWDEEQILLAFKRDPGFLTSSENKIKKALDFYTNTMNLDPHFVISVPRLLMYSIEKRIIPRYNVLKVLEYRKLIQGINEKAAWSLTISEENFLKNYILKYMVEVPGILELYPGADKSLKKFIDKFKSDASAILEMYPGVKNFLSEYFEK